MNRIYKLKPSSLSKYGIECPHCLWMGMNANWNQRSLNLSMYGTLSRHIENKLQGQATEKYLPELGKGKVVETGGGVCSGKLPLDSKADFYIAGNFDHLAEFAVALLDVSNLGSNQALFQDLLFSVQNLVPGSACSGPVSPEIIYCSSSRPPSVILFLGSYANSREIFLAQVFLQLIPPLLVLLLGDICHDITTRAQGNRKVDNMISQIRICGMTGAATGACLVKVQALFDSGLHKWIQAILVGYR